MFLSYLFSHWIDPPAKRCWDVIYSLNETVLQVMLRFSGVRLPAPFTLLQTVPKPSPEPGTHPVLQFQSVFLAYFTWSDFKALISSFSAVRVTSRTEKSIRDTVKVVARYALKCGVSLQTSPPPLVPLKMSAIMKSVSMEAAPSNQPHHILF